MDRITFLRKLTGTILVGLPLVSIIGCTSSDDDEPNNPGNNEPDNPGNNGTANCLANGTKSSIAKNHGHVLKVSVNDIEAGVDKQYDIMGTATHAHTVTVTATNFATLKTNQQIQVSSTTGDSHTHSVTVSCA